MVADFFSNITWKTALDVGLVAVLFYQIIAMLKGTRAAQVLIGMLVIFLAYLLSSLLELETLNWIISKFYSSFIFVVIVLFQDDIRRLLTRFGRGPFVSGLDETSGLRVIDEVVNAAKYLSHDRIGALVVFERGIGLDRLYDHAVRIESLVSEQILVCIFQSFSPLHDGAVIVQKNRLTCASAQLPLSKNPSFSKKLGTRHSAAVGISEETDAVVLVVSEETGTISIAADGLLHKQSSIESVRRTLVHFLMPHSERSGRFGFKSKTFNRILNGFFSHSSGGAKVPVDLKEHTEQSSMEWKSIEMQNRLASSPSPAQVVRFPKLSKVGDAEEARLVVLAQRGEGSAAAAGALRKQSQTSANEKGDFGEGEGTGAPQSIGNSSDGQESVEEGVSSASQYSPMERADQDESYPNYSINKAAAALTQLSAEERFVPPLPPNPPPRDVSIGGVSLNPPKEEFEKSPKSENADKLEKAETSALSENSDKLEKTETSAISENSDKKED